MAWIYVEEVDVAVAALILIDLFRDVKVTGFSPRLPLYSGAALEGSTRHAQ